MPPPPDTCFLQMLAAFFAGPAQKPKQEWAPC
jgi:hypothetical protein